MLEGLVGLPAMLGALTLVGDAGLRNRCTKPIWDEKIVPAPID